MRHFNKYPHSNIPKLCYLWTKIDLSYIFQRDKNIKSSRRTRTNKVLYSFDKWLLYHICKCKIIALSSSSDKLQCMRCVKVTKLQPIFLNMTYMTQTAHYFFLYAITTYLSDEPFRGLFCQTKTYHAYSSKDAIKSFADLILTYIFTKKADHRC